jgi:TPR repeat protein
MMEKIQSAFDRGDYHTVFNLGLLNLAIEGHPAAQEIAGNCYQLGLGVPIDTTQAVQWYKAAIAQNSGLAANNLAGIIARGYDGYPPDRPQAQALLDQAQSLGFDHAPKKLPPEI